MKKNINKNIIVLLIIIIFIICGIITVFTTGFEKSAEYKSGTRIEVFIPQGYEKDDIISIANECFNEKIFNIEKIEKLEQIAGIKINDYTEDEFKNFKSKISDKYEIEEEKLEIHEVKVPAKTLKNIIEPYFLPLTIVTILTLIYIIIINIKSSDKFTRMLKILLKLTLVLAVYFSIILVFRFPVGIYTMPVALALYIITILILVNNEKK